MTFTSDLRTLWWHVQYTRMSYAEDHEYRVLRERYPIPYAIMKAICPTEKKRKFIIAPHWKPEWKTF
jgi:hypothetical protein